jgi:hypothetical protein
MSAKKLFRRRALKPVVKDDCANHKGTRSIVMTVSSDLNTIVEPRASTPYEFNPVGGPRAESISHCHLLTTYSTITSTDRSSVRTGTHSLLPLLQRDVTSIGTCQQVDIRLFPTHLLYTICRVCNKCMCSISTGPWMSYAQWRNSYTRFLFFTKVSF